MKILKGVFSVVVFIFIRPIGYLVYDRKYLTGRWFHHLYSHGWLWVLKGFLWQKIFGFNRNTPWPVSPRMTVMIADNIVFHADDLNNFQGSGIYLQGFAKTEIGRGTYIASNVGLITANHNLKDLNEHDEPRSIILGEKCWVGMNSVILPGVVLGDHTVVGAGSVVTKSFEDGYCVIAGNPAKIIRKLEKNDFGMAGGSMGE